MAETGASQDWRLTSALEHTMIANIPQMDPDDAQMTRLLLTLSGTERKDAAFIYTGTLRPKHVFTMVQRLAHRIMGLTPKRLHQNPFKVVFENGSILWLVSDFRAAERLQGIEWEAIEVHQDVNNDRLRDEVALIVDRCARQRANRTP